MIEDINLLHKIEVPKDIKQIPKRSGIYFLFNSGMKLIYIGETVNLYKRIIEHLPTTSFRLQSKSSFENEVKFISFIEVGKEKLSKIEKKFISKYKPFYIRSVSSYLRGKRVEFDKIE